MLPFSGKKQEQVIWQEINITNEAWQKHQDKIMAEHRLPAAKEQLEQQWRAWIAQDAFKACREVATRAQTASEIQEYDEYQFTAFMT
jgi:hypothetical protein